MIVTLLPIGAAATQLGVAPSTLRYYEQRGLLAPAERRAGQRMYGQPELRRLAFLHLAGQLGIPLAIAGAVLDEPAQAWRETVTDQIAQLQDLIERARGAQQFLTHALECPTEHPTTQCSTLTRSLDHLITGATVEELAADQS